MPGAYLLLLAQAVAGPPAPVAPRLPVERPCPPDADPDEVVVCGNPDTGRFRLRALAEPPARAGLPPAQVRIGRGTLSVGTEAGAVGNIPTNRAKVTLRVPF